MNATVNMEKYTDNNGRMHPKKFALMLLIIGMTMLFAGLTSAFLVRHAEGNWDGFKLPSQFVYSTVTVVIGSLTMFGALKSAQRDNLRSVQVLLAITLLMGVAFTYLQFQGFADMAARGYYFVPSEGGANGTISGSFVIMLIGLHLLHLLGGVVFLTVVLVKSLMLKVHKKNTLSISMCNTYWHFVGLLWLYLYLFLYFVHQV